MLKETYLVSERNNNQGIEIYGVFDLLSESKDTHHQETISHCDKKEESEIAKHGLHQEVRKMFEFQWERER